MRSHKALAAVVAPLVVLAVVLALRHLGSRGSDGPLIVGGAHGEYCLPTPSDGQVSYGYDPLRNTASAPAAISAVRLVGPSGVRLLGAYVAPIRNDTMHGILQGWPPSTEFTDSRAEWEDKRPAVGAEVPAASEDRESLLLHLDVRQSGGFEAIEVDYEVDGTPYTARTALAFTTRSSCR